MKKLLTFSVLLFVIFGTVSVLDSGIVVQDICADTIVQPGISCINQKSTCPTGYEIASDFFERANYLQIESSKIVSAFNRVYDGNGLNTICINSEFSTIIPVFTSSDTYSLNYYVFLNEVNTSTTSVAAEVEVPKLCPGGWIADQGNYAHRVLGAGGFFPPWGCCPPGYNFINRGNDVTATDANSYQPGVCAKPSIGGLIPDYLDTTDGDKGIYTKEGIAIVNFDATPTYRQFNSWDELNSQIGTVDYIYSYFSSTIGAPVQPQLGQGFGSFFNDSLLDGSIQSRLVTGTPFIGSVKACPSTASCGLTNRDINSLVSSNSFKTNSTLTCSKCFVEGDVVGYSTDAATGYPDGFVGFCKAGTLDKKPLINGNITDTVEYYLADAANQPYLAACKASGGIYTAIGCVDPSPMGLITGLIRITLGVVGGIALLQLIYVGIMYQMGDEAKIKEARSRLIATITGVAVLIFSILILRIIGVNVLDILPAGAI